MNVFYEEDGAFRAGSVLADQGAAYQVESASGKRTKVKTAHVLFDFREPAPAAVMKDGAALAESIDLDFLWECAPQDEFSFADLGADYYGRTPTPAESAALIMRLHGAPMYFYRKGRGRYRSAPAEALKAALASMARKQREAATQAHYVEELKAHHLPDALRTQVRELLWKPDKNRIEYKALAEACGALGTTAARLMLATGGFATAKDLHRERFLFEQFPRGIAFSEMAQPASPADLPLAAVEAFSIDDHTTTEIDDAFSVTALPDADGVKRWRIGIHIAAPGLSIAPDDAIDRIARDRYSTVYAPGEKITMLPDAAIESFTLAAGRACPALSLYVEADEGSDEDNDTPWTVTATESRIERISMGDNLRHNALDEFVTAQNLAVGAGEYPRKAEIAVLWRFAQSLHAGRQAARVASGLKPEAHHRSDYNFYVDRAEDGSEERIAITERRRGAPLDTLVAELMILANSTWGKFLADRGVPGIYRAQNTAFGPAGRVRMVTHPAPHVGLGVAQYAWSTSPLRRYVDLVNQWQLLACVAQRAAPFKKNDAELFAIVSGFDAAYTAYADYQATMERYWCLRWLQQERVKVADANVTGREDGARFVDLPLLVRVSGLAALPSLLPRGTRIEVEIGAIDEVDLSVACTLAAIIEEVDELEDETDVEDDDAARVIDPSAAVPAEAGPVHEVSDTASVVAHAEAPVAALP